jgi:hypothetical protein
MAAYDIMPFRYASSSGGIIRTGGMAASEVFDVGEVVMFNDDGLIEEGDEDATQIILGDLESDVGIACYGPGGGSQTDDRAAHINPKTGVAFTTGDEVAFWPADAGTQFITQNLYAAAAGSAVTPAETDIGESYQLVYATFGTPDAGWGLERTAGVAGTDVRCVVVDVLDSNLAPIRATSGSGNTGVWVVFDMRTT